MSARDRTPSRALLLLCLLLPGAVHVCRANSLVGPGAMQNYRGGGQGRARATGRVSEFPAGFFVAGSTLRGVNGLYGKAGDSGIRGPETLLLPKALHLLYTNRETGWMLAFVNSKAIGYEAVGGEDSEWLFIDPQWKDRFAHAGATYLPGAGEKWKHVHRPIYVQKQGFKNKEQVVMRQTLEGFWERGDRAEVQSLRPRDEMPVGVKLEATQSTYYVQPWRVMHADVWEQYEEGGAGAAAGGGGPGGSAVTEREEGGPDDEDELPWQVVAIMSADKMAEMYAHLHQHKETTARAMSGKGLPRAGPGSRESRPPEGDEALHPLVAAEEAAAAADHPRAALLYAEALLTVPASHRWRRAVLLTRQARSQRKARQLTEAGAALREAMEIYPSYADALFEAALTALDHELWMNAIGFLETLVTVDREYDGLEEWLLRAHAMEQRYGSGQIPNTPWHIGEYVQLNPNLAIDRPQHRGMLGVITGMGPPEHPLYVTLQDGSKYHLGSGQVQAPAPEQQARLHGQAARGLPQPLPAAAAASASGAGSLSPSAPAEGAATDPVPKSHYALLQVAVDVGPEELKRAYKDSSRRLHPDKPGGSTDLFQRVAVAHGVLSDDAQRRTYDTGRDLRDELDEDWSSIRDDVERRYFPDKAGFQLFGDPLEAKRRIMQNREEQRKKEERDAQVRLEVQAEAKRLAEERAELRAQEKMRLDGEL